MTVEEINKAYECCKNSFNRRCDDCPVTADCCHDKMPLFVLKYAIELLEDGKELGKELGDAVELIRKKDERIKKMLKEQSWIKCSDRMPEEHETIFAKLKGTDKWNESMFEKMSDDVRVVEVFENGARRVFHSQTIDGKWECEKHPLKRTVTHWMPNPELPND